MDTTFIRLLWVCSFRVARRLEISAANIAILLSLLFIFLCQKINMILSPLQLMLLHLIKEAVPLQIIFHFSLAILLHLIDKILPFILFILIINFLQIAKLSQIGIRIVNQLLLVRTVKFTFLSFDVSCQGVWGHIPMLKEAHFVSRFHFWDVKVFKFYFAVLRIN